MFFSNTNRTNRTNLVGCDMVYIRLIREICGHLNTPVILHSICSIALCKPAATELKSKNTHGVSLIYYGVFSRICFFDFFFDLYFDFRLIVPWQDKRDFRLILWEENCESMDGSCGLPAVSLWDNVSAPMLHLWCKGAALLLALLFESLYALFPFCWQAISKANQELILHSITARLIHEGMRVVWG